MQSSINQRFVLYCTKKGIRQVDLVLANNAAKQTISYIWNGRTKPGCEFLEKFIADHSDLNARWLFTGEGDMTEKVDTESQTIIMYLEKKIRKKDDEIADLNRKLRDSKVDNGSEEK